MAHEMTNAEISRAISRLENEHGTFVGQTVYERDMKEIRGDIHEIKDSLKWATRFIAGLFVTVILQLAFIVINQLPPP